MMVKKILTSSLCCAVLLLSGCGDSTDAEKRLSAQQNLDKGDFAATIETLEAKENPTDEDKMLLASSYMGEAGFSFTETIALVTEASQSENSDETFSSLIKEVESKKDEDTLNNLQKAIDYYTAIVGVAPSAAPSRLSPAAKAVGDRDLFLSLAYMTKATTVLSYLGDVSKLGTNEDAPELFVSGCAILNIYRGEDGAGCNVVRNQSNHSLTINVDGIDYYRLADAGFNDMILTDYSKSPLTPITIGGVNVTIEGVLIDTINYAFDKLVEFAPKDMKDDAHKFKSEIGQEINADTIADYIAKTTI